MSAYLDHAQRGRTAWWRYLLATVLGIVFSFAVDTGLGAGLILTRILPHDFPMQLMNPGQPIAFFVGNGVVFATMIGGFALMAWLLQKKTPLDIIGEWRWTRFGAGVAIWTLCLGLATLVDFALQPGGFRWTATAQTPVLALSALFGLGVQTFAEEFVFRGYFTQGLLLMIKRPLPTALVSGLIFGVMHIPNGWPQFANATLFGVLTALIAMRTGGLAFTYGLHLVNNLFGAIVVVSADDVFKGAPGLFTQHTPGLLWWDVASGVLLLAIPAWLVLRPPAVKEPTEASV